MQLFYNPDFNLLAPFLPEEEARHCIKVMRLGPGDTVQVTDGKGNVFTTQLSSTDIKKCRLTVTGTQADFGKKPYYIHLAIAPTKNADRTEWLVEKCVELGIDEISFIACEHSERRVFKTDRLEKIAVSAMKQSLKAYMPLIHEVVPFRQFVEKTVDGQKFIAYVDEAITEGDRKRLQASAEPNGQYCVLIGPEGDFSPGEINMAIEKGYLPVSLGESRLRTETAGMVACHLLHVIQPHH